MKRGMASNERAQGVLRQRMKDRTRILEDDMRAVLGTREGRAVLLQILRDSGVWTQKLFAGEEGYRFDGQRNFGVALAERIQADEPDSWLLMHAERVAQETEDAKVRREAAQIEDDDG